MSWLSLSYHSALKRTKEFQALQNVRPTLRNKPSGLKSDWVRTVSSKSSVRHQPASSVHRRMSSSSTLKSPAASSFSPSFSPSESDHTSTLVAMSPIQGSTNRFSPPFYGDLVPIASINAGNGRPSAEVIHALNYYRLQLTCPLPATVSAACIQGRRRKQEAGWSKGLTGLVARELSRPIHSSYHRTSLRRRQTMEQPNFSNTPTGVQ